MRAGLVLGAVWATKKSPALTGQSLLRVRCGRATGSSSPSARRRARGGRTCP